MNSRYSAKDSITIVDNDRLFSPEKETLPSLVPIRITRNRNFKSSVSTSRKVKGDKMHNKIK